MLTCDDLVTLYDAVYLYGADYGAAMSDYPIWNENKRSWLNQMIFERFQYRKIGTETPAYFLFLLRRTMRECMIGINPVFKALDTEFDILEGFDTVSKSETANKVVFSATPQTRLSGEENYATSLNETSDATENETSGRTMPVGDMLTSWVTGVNNALYLVYNEVEQCFIQVF